MSEARDDRDQQDTVVHEESWGKLQEESPKAFRAFSLYRDLGASRSHSLVAEILLEESPERKQPTVVSQLKGWFAQHRWVERAGEYDVYLDQRGRAQAEREREGMSRRYRGGAAALAERVLQRLDPTPPEGVTPLDANGLTFAEAARCLDRMQMIEDRSMPSGARIGLHLNCISPDDYRKLARGMFEVALRNMPEERRPRYAADVEAFWETGNW